MRRWLPFILYNAGQGWVPQDVVDAQAPDSPVALLSVDGPMGGLRRSPKAQEELDFSLEVKALAEDQGVDVIRMHRVRHELYGELERDGTYPGFDLDWLETLPEDEWVEDFEARWWPGAEFVDGDGWGDFWSRAVAHWQPRGRMPIPYAAYGSLGAERCLVQTDHPGYVEWSLRWLDFLRGLTSSPDIYVVSKTNMWVEPREYQSNANWSRTPYGEWHQSMTRYASALSDAGYGVVLADNRAAFAQQGDWFTEHGMWDHVIGLAERVFSTPASLQQWIDAGRPLSPLPE